jgi:hypothetical protein
MPYGGVPGRAEQVATLSRLVHEMLVSRETAELIAALEEPKPCSGVGPRRADRDGHRPPAGDGPLLALPEEQVRRAVRPEFGLDVAHRAQHNGGCFLRKYGVWSNGEVGSSADHLIRATDDPEAVGQQYN